MICLGCRKTFFIKRNIWNLFSNDKYLLCSTCSKLDLMVENIGLDNGILTILSLLKAKKKIDYNLYINELSYIFNKYCNDYFIVIIEELFVSVTILKIVDWLMEIEGKNVLIITFIKKN